MAWPPRSDQLLISSDRAGRHDIHLVDVDNPVFTSPVIRSVGDDVVGAWAPDVRVALVSTRDGNAEIDVAASLTQAPERVAPDPSGDWLPSWAPDGSLVFNSGRYGTLPELVRLAHGASDLQRLTRDSNYDAGAEVSPDGTWILFDSRRNDNYDLYVRSIEGSEERRLTTDPGDDSYGSWSPDGARIAFRSTRDGDPEIYILTVATSEVVRLTHWPGSVENYPAWSPDGRHIAFVSDRDGNDEIYMVPAPSPAGQVMQTRDGSRPGGCHCWRGGFGGSPLFGLHLTTAGAQVGRAAEPRVVRPRLIA